MSRRYCRHRLTVFACVVSLGMAAVFGRLVQVQLLDHHEWRQKATAMSTTVEKLSPRRGAILDRLGYPLAVTEERYRVGVSDPGRWARPENAARMGEALGLSAEAVQRKLRGREGHTYLHREAVLEPGLAERLSHWPGVSVERHLDRRYPMDAVAARLLGRVRHDDHGDAGIEQACDDVLAGRPGRQLLRYDASATGEAIMSQVVEKPEPGRDVVLTLDHRVQMILEEELEATRRESGAVSALGVVMDPRDGSVLAMASAPGIGSRTGQPYVSSRWRDPVVLDAFEPGSCFKLFTFASLLSRAVVDTSEIFDGEGHEGQYRSSADLGGFTFHDVHPVGEVSLRHAFAVSSNIITGKAASLLERVEFFQDLRRFGLGDRTDCGLPGESPGILADSSRWSGRSQATIAIGQEVGVTLLQLAAGYAALLTDGTLRSPRLVHALRDADGGERILPPRVIRESVVPPQVIPQLRALCRAVVAEPYGTGRKAAVEGLNVAGKTGTAQVADRENGGYLSGVFSADFVGVVPAEAPRLLCAIVVHEPHVEKRWGGDTAATCFSRVVSKILSGTELLDHPAPRLSVAAARDQAPLPLPALVGLRADRVLERLQRGGWVPASTPPDPLSRVVGQFPAAGSRVPAGGRVHLAWSMGGRP